MNQGVRLVSNHAYWKSGLPYLDAIEWKLVSSRSTRILACTSGDYELTSPNDISVPLMHSVRRGTILVRSLTNQALATRFTGG